MPSPRLPTNSAASKVSSLLQCRHILHQSRRPLTTWTKSIHCSHREISSKSNLLLINSQLLTLWGSACQTQILEAILSFSLASRILHSVLEFRNTTSLCPNSNNSTNSNSSCSRPRSEPNNSGASSKCRWIKEAKSVCLRIHPNNRTLGSKLLSLRLLLWTKASAVSSKLLRATLTMVLATLLLQINRSRTKCSKSLETL